MSFLSVLLAIALLFAVYSWLTGRRLPIFRKSSGGEHTQYSARSRRRAFDPTSAIESSRRQCNGGGAAG